MIREHRFQVPEDAAGERLDALLSRFAGFPLRQVVEWVEMGGAYVDRQRQGDPSSRVPGGATVELLYSDPPEEASAPLAPEALLLRRHGVIVVNKPAGVHGQAARHRVAGTLPDLVAGLLGLTSPVDPVNRLDRDTSGIVVLGADGPTRGRLGTLWAQGRVSKTYLGVAWVGGPRGAPPDEGRLVRPIGPDGRHAGRMQVGGREAQPARTIFQVLARSDGAALLALRPLTGRTHQVRVHCAAEGWPLLGDTFYAPPETRHLAPRLALHAWRVRLPRQVLGEACRVEAPLPDDFRAILEAWKLSLPLVKWEE